MKMFPGRRDKLEGAIYLLSLVCYIEHFYCWNENIIYSQSEIRSQPGNRTFRYIGGFKYEFNKKTQLAFILGQDYIFRKNKFENIFSLTLKHQLN